MAKKSMVIVGGVRTAIGKFGGSLRDVNAEHLLAYCFRHVVKKSGIDPVIIDEVIAGNICQPVGNIARVAALYAKVPVSVPGTTVSRNCASGIEAISRACQAAAAGDGEVFLVGGTENMSQVPYIMRDARFGLKMMNHVLTDALWEGLFDPNIKQMMGRTAENVVQKWRVSRDDQDTFAVNSHRKAVEAQKRHFFDSQILPLKIQERVVIKTDEDSSDKVVARSQVVFGEDESPSEKLLQSPGDVGNAPAVFMNDDILSPVCVWKFIDKDGTFVVERSVYDQGTVTPANSCPMNDGAAALLVMTEEAANSLKLKPLARIVSYAYVGCSPELMGEGPMYAVPKALTKAGLGMDDIDIFELNEAFAGQAIACQRVLGIPDEKLNVWGGAIALGHPVGATGTNLTIKAEHILRETNKRYAAITMCVGGGQGGCLIIERI